ncbi:MAG: energy transducer TonB [Gammaproteobacteria bacterium]|nr:energy transducer TonB [Gammaproteobacteria bacterium]
MSIKPTHWCAAIVGAIGVHLVVFGFLSDYGLRAGALEPGDGGFEVGLGLAQEPVAVPEETIEAPPERTEPPEEEEVLPEPEVEEIPEPVEVVESPPLPVPEAALEDPTSFEPPKFAIQPPSGESVPQEVAPVGAGSSLTYGGDVGVSDVYIARLAARLNRFKYYPIESLRNGEIGVTVLSLVINRRGQVLDSRISNSSGFTALDQAALRIVNNAKPLPRFDRRMKMDELRVNIPITFDITERRTR